MDSRFAFVHSTYLFDTHNKLIKMATVDTENYFAIAISDDLASTSAEATPIPNEAAPQEDKASKKARREERIAEAVRRSRVEYKPGNVYTERRVSHQYCSRDHI